VTTSRADGVRALYRQAFGSDPAVVASAPARVNLIGEHTDYNGGDVLPMALALRTCVAMGAAEGRTSRAVSAQEGEAGAFDAPRAPRAGKWWDYLSGTAAALEDAGMSTTAVNVAVSSDVPTAAGLSSSAALEVATAAAFTSLGGRQLEPIELARVAHRAETEYVGVASGIMDQFASALGAEKHALLIACDTEAVRPVPFAETVLVFDTAVPRSLRTSAYNTRRRECDEALQLLRALDPSLAHLARASSELVAHARLPETLARRARHVVEETARVAELVQGLARGEPVNGAILYASHESLRDLYECSSPELDWFVERARGAAGVRGARLTGAGWGGCAIAVGDREPLEAFARELTAPYARELGREGRWWLSDARDGVRIES
jgi:galactokinase